MEHHTSKSLHKGFVSKNVVFDEKSMLQEKTKMEDKAQGGTSDSSANSQSKEFEFSNDPSKLVGSDENSSDSDGDMHEATQKYRYSLDH